LPAQPAKMVNARARVMNLINFRGLLGVSLKQY